MFTLFEPFTHRDITRISYLVELIGDVPRLFEDFKIGIIRSVMIIMSTEINNKYGI